MPRSPSCLLAGLLCATAASAQSLTHVRLASSAAPELARSLERQGYDVVEGSVQTSSLELVVGDGELALLRDLGFALEVLQVGRPFAEMQAELGATPERPGYPDLAAVLARMSDAAASFPAICQLVDLTDRYGAAPTFEGRHLFAVKISDNVTLEEDEPACMVVAAHHCRETVTPLIALEALERLTGGYGVDQAITSAVDANEIWIAPVWNPDGYEYVFTVNNLWRKNRRPVGNGVGIDLNRNYPFGWSAPCAGSSAPSSCTYKGPSAGSEAETQLMMTWSLDQRWAKVLDYHSFAREVLWGYSCTSHPLDNFFRTDAIRLANISGYGGANRRPSAEGEEYEWQIATFGSSAFLLETALAFQPPIASAEAEAEQLWPGILAFLRRVIPVQGHVTDACSGEPLAAQITFGSFALPNGEQVSSGGAFGRYDVFLPAGPETLTFSAPGYAPQSIQVSVSETASLELDVALEASLALSFEAPSSGTALGGFVHVQAPCLYAARSFVVLGTPADTRADARLLIGPPAPGASFHRVGVLDAAGRATVELSASTRARAWTYLAVVAAPGGAQSSAPLTIAP